MNLDDVPELSPEAKAFLQAHAQTGEPSAEALERGRSRLHRPVYRTTKMPPCPKFEAVPPG